MQVWEHLNVMAVRRPIAGNMGGSALTMFSSQGLVFGVLQVSCILRQTYACISVSAGHILAAGPLRYLLCIRASGRHSRWLGPVCWRSAHLSLQALRGTQ